MSKFFKTVVLTGLFVGTTDLISAFTTTYIQSGHFPDKMFKYVAAGALGIPTALKGGVWVDFLGLFFHYFIAFSFTLFFFWIFPRLKFLSFNKYLAGMLYAVFVRLMMEQVILRFAALPFNGSFNLAHSYINWVITGILFGIPIAYNTYKYYGIKTE